MMQVPLHSHPDRLLTDHLREVEEAARLILGRHPAGPFGALGIDVELVLWALAGWHDVAKGTDFFQDYITDIPAFERRARAGDPSANPALKTHTPLGSLLAMMHWSGLRDPLQGTGVHTAEIDGLLASLLVALAVRGHHTRLPFQRKLRDGMQIPELPEQMARLPGAVESCHPSLAGAVGPLLAMDFEELQLDVLDLLDDAFGRLSEMPLERRIRYRLAVQFCFSCLLEADKALLIHSDVAGYIGQPGMQVSATLVEDHPPDGENCRPIDHQRRAALNEVVAAVSSTALDDYRPRTLTLPTGLGKTRCAAAWAFHWRARHESAGLPRPKVLVVLPFLSVIEQTARVYREELLQMARGVPGNDATLSLSHSLSARDFDDLESPEQAEFALDTWRSDIIMTTFDQFLLSLMDARAKYQQRFHNLCDALVIIDEVQAFPCRLWHPVGNLLAELATAGRTRLLLMTATQPGLIGPGKSVPIIAAPADFFQPRYRLEWDLSCRPLETWLDNLTEEMARPEKAGVRKWLVVLNTRRAAQATYRHFRGRRARDDVFLLSSDIVPRDRLARITAVRESKSCVAVTTQCVEAGVDLDMDCVVRDFGPLDSLVQVAGRCNRHGGRERSLVRIVFLTNTDDRNRPFCSYIYNGDDVRLPTTHEILNEFGKNNGIEEEQLGPAVEEYFRRLRSYMDTGAATTKAWANFEHEELNVARLLRDSQDQVTFVVGKLDLGLRQEVERAMAVKDRWQRRRELRRLAPRIALVSVSTWKSAHYTPDDVADPLPHNWKTLGWDAPSFWFLHDDAYDKEVGLCPSSTPACLLF